MPRRRDDVDALEALGAEDGLQRPEWKSARMLLAVEPFLLQNVDGDTVDNERQPGVMSSRHDAESAHRDAPISSLERKTLASTAAVCIAVSFERQRVEHGRVPLAEANYPWGHQRFGCGLGMGNAVAWR